MAYKSFFKMSGNSTDSILGNNGTDTAMTYSNLGPTGKCAVFNGTTSKFTGTAPAITGNFTVGVWMLRNGTSPANHGIYDIGTYSTTGYGIWGYDNSAFNPPGNTIDWRINGTYNNYAAINTSGGATNWDRIIFAYDGTNVYTYKNGVKVSTIAQTTNPSSATTYTMGVRGDAAVYYKGSLTNAFTDNTAWSVANVKNDYSFTKGFI